MRIRSTKPDFWRSERIGSVSWDARLVLKGLESYVDDNGVGKDDIALIVGDLFQRDLVREPSRTLARVSEAISELAEAGLLWRYDADGTPLLYVAFWETVQRVDKPQPGRFRRPDGTMNYKESLIRESDKNIREDSRGFAPGTGEQGNRGTGKEPPYPPKRETETSQPPARRTGSEIARARFAAIQTTGSSLARQIADAYNQTLQTPLAPKLLHEVADQIDVCLQAHNSPDAIARGIQAWTESDSWSPSQIPNHVHKANNGRRTNGVSKPTETALDYQAAGEALLAKLSTA